MEKKLRHVAALSCVVSATLLVTSVCFAGSTLSMSVHQTVHAGVMSPVYVQTVDNAVCSLHPRDTNDPTVTTRLFTDDRDIVEFQITLNAVGDVADLVMDCSANDGLGPSVTHSIEVRAVPLQDPIVSDTDSLKDVPPRGRKLLPLGADEQKLSNVELMARGYPPRPDASTSPGQYKHWKEIVSRSWTIAESRHAAQRWDDVPAYRGILSAPSGYWDGYVLGNQITCDTTVMNNPVYTYIEGQFAVPSPSGGYWNTKAAMSEWIGIGGDGSRTYTTLIQAGADGVVTCYQPWCVTTAYLWKEVAPDNLVKLHSPLVQPGDWLELSITIVDGNGVPNTSGPNGSLWMANASTGEVISNSPQHPKETTISTASYAAYHFAGESAEWIIERLSHVPDSPDCTHWPASAAYCLLADFGSSHMTETAAVAANCPWTLNYLQPGNNVEQLSMYSCDSNANCPSIATVASGSQTYEHRADMTFNWLNFY